MNTTYIFDKNKTKPKKTSTGKHFQIIQKTMKKKKDQVTLEKKNLSVSQQFLQTHTTNHQFGLELTEYLYFFVYMKSLTLHGPA